MSADVETCRPAGPASVATGARVERLLSPHEAERCARMALRELGLRPRVWQVGSRDGLSAWRCRLLDGAGRAVPHGTGCGKGGAADARTGAVFEALEHHLTGPECFDPTRVRFAAGPELAAGPLSEEACAPVLADLPEVACHLYNPLPDVPGPRPPVPVPVVLSTSWYLDRPDLRAAAGDPGDYRQLARYGSNSGSAIGVTGTEALLHAVNEVVERDALSLLLARCFLAPAAERFRPQVVDPATLPTELATALHTVERMLGAPVALLHATTDLGVPTFVAYSPRAPLVEARFGAGTSLSARYAAWRALSELAQGALVSAAVAPIPAPPLDAFTRHPRLLACARADMTEPLARADRIAFPDDGRPPADVATQLRTLTALLVNAGYPPYYRVPARLPGGITTVHVIAPGLERFMAVLSGVLLLPGSRARAAAREVGR